jgi:hypothetical protein
MLRSRLSADDVRLQEAHYPFDFTLPDAGMYRKTDTESRTEGIHGAPDPVHGGGDHGEAIFLAWFSINVSAIAYRVYEDDMLYFDSLVDDPIITVTQLKETREITFKHFWPDAIGVSGQPAYFLD